MPSTSAAARRSFCQRAPAPRNVIATLQKNLESLGFVLAEDVVDQLRKLSLAQVDSFYQRLVKDLLVLMSAHREFKPMYPGFPAQVMEMSEAELYLRAIVHYWTLKLPKFGAAKREPLENAPKFRFIQLGTREEFEGIFTHLAASKTPFSPQDR